MNVLSEENDGKRNTEFRLHTGYTNVCVNSKAKKLVFEYSNFVLNKYAENPENCRFPITLGLHKKYINRWSGRLFGYFIPIKRTGQHIWMTSPVWNSKVKGFKLRKDIRGNEYILTKFGKIYAYDYLSTPTNQLGRSYIEMRGLMKRQLDYITSLGYLEEYNSAYLPGYIEITSVEELQDYYGGIAKTLDAY